MRSRLVVCCEKALIDSNSGTFSIIGVLERLNSTKFPLIADCATVVFVEKDPEGGEYEFRLILNSEGGRQGVMGSESATLSPGGGLWRLRLVGLQLPEPGSYTVRFQWKQQGSEEWATSEHFWRFEALKTEEPEAALKSNKDAQLH